MAFESVGDFLKMGTHGVYVWLAYGVTFSAIMWNAIQPLVRRKLLLDEQYAHIKRAQRDEKMNAK